MVAAGCGGDRVDGAAVKGRDLLRSDDLGDLAGRRRDVAKVKPRHDGVLLPLQPAAAGVAACAPHRGVAAAALMRWAAGCGWGGRGRGGASCRRRLMRRGADAGGGRRLLLPPEQLQLLGVACGCCSLF